MDFPIYHRPVLLEEALDGLAVRPGRRYIDCTAGEGGHSQAILQRCLPGGHLLAIDADPGAIAVARCRLQAYQPDLTLVQDSYARFEEIAHSHNFGLFDGILFDVGLSSLQLEASGRGFSFRRDEPLDMRYDPAGSVTAAHIVNTYSQEALARLIRDYGEERRARAIAKAIVHVRPIATSKQLAEVVRRIVGPARGGIHPATRTFQALRIAVNGELENLKAGLNQAIRLLKPGGRLVVISYHSLEDRLVKTTFQRESRGCICPSDVLECACDHVASMRVITPRIIAPSAEERRQNPRSRSARMRVAEGLQGMGR